MRTADQPEFRSIIGYEGLYMVSEYGDILSIGRQVINSLGRTYKLKDRIMSPGKTKGYLCMSLTDRDGNKKRFSVHRLLAQAFIPNPKNLPHINHIDYNRSNNCISNLEWCDISHNMKHAHQKADRKPGMLGRCGKLSPRSRPVIVFDKQGNFLANYDSLASAAKANGSHNCRISACCSGRSKSANGLIFKYAN